MEEQVRRQIEYYFSEENLERDLFLRGKMEILGYISLTVIVQPCQIAILWTHRERIVYEQDTRADACLWRTYGQELAEKS